jgi:hypothetical protein
MLNYFSGTHHRKIPVARRTQQKIQAQMTTNLFCYMYELSMRQPVWAAEIKGAQA